MEGIFGRSIKLKLSKINKEHTWLLVQSRDEDDSPQITLAGFGQCLSIDIPDWLCPPHYYESEYKDKKITLPAQKCYGLSLYLDHFAVHFGIVEDDYLGRFNAQEWSGFLPWMEWEHVRHCIYNPDGSLFADLTNLPWEEHERLETSCPSVTFRFLDFDGEEIEAECKIEEREWRKGTGWFKWLRWFVKPTVRRSLDLRFSKEMGPEKKSYKGGMLGTGCELGNKSPEQAFRSFCEQRQMTFVGEVNSLGCQNG